MTAPATRLAYGDAYEYLDRALDDPAGIRIECGSKAEAYTLRSRLHYARRVDRNDNSIALPLGDELHAKSVYDILVCRIKEDTTGGWWVYIERAVIGDKVIESLSED